MEGPPCRGDLGSLRCEASQGVPGEQAAFLPGFAGYLARSPRVAAAIVGTVETAVLRAPSPNWEASLITHINSYPGAGNRGRLTRLEAGPPQGIVALGALACKEGKPRMTSYHPRQVTCSASGTSSRQDEHKLSWLPAGAVHFGASSGPWRRVTE